MIITTLPESIQLNTRALSHVFDNMAECYKLFWFKALLEHVNNGESEISFDAMANTMIKDAWYMVSEYRLNLGPADALEAVVIYLQEKSNLISSVKEKELMEFLESFEDKEYMNLKKRVCDNVPYRLQSAFLPEMRGSIWNSNYAAAQYINLQKGLIYTFNSEVTTKGGSYLKKAILVSDTWAEYLKVNCLILQGWADYNLIEYLQRRNPSVPGIVNKIHPPQERKLEKAKAYWKAVIHAREIINIYSGAVMTEKDVSIDHFVPWSYVAHDELWNLVPTTRSVNSSKSNHLPKWDTYFPLLADAEYKAYELVNEYDHMRDLHMDLITAKNKCMKEHVNDEKILHSLYVPGQDRMHFMNQLEEILLPSYESARNLGFKEWTYGR